MALGVVQTQKAANHTTNTVRTATFSPATTAGNLLVAVLCGALNSSVDPTFPASWVKRVGGIGPATFGIWIYEYVNNPGSITTVTVTHGASVSAVTQLYILEASGARTTAPFDQSGSVASGATALTKTDTATGVNTVAHVLVVSGYMQESLSAITFTDATSGYTQAQTDTLGETGALSWKITSATETSADTGTSTLSRIWDMALATYMEVGGVINTQALSGTLSFSGSYSRQANKRITGTLSFVGKVSKSIVHQGLTATLNFVGNITKPVTLHQALTGGLSFVGSVAGQWQVPGVIIAGAIVTFAKNILSLTASMSPTGSVSEIRWYTGPFKYISKGSMRSIFRGIRNIITQNRNMI